MLIYMAAPQPDGSSRIRQGRRVSAIEAENDVIIDLMELDHRRAEELRQATRKSTAYQAATLGDQWDEFVLAVKVELRALVRRWTS